MVVVHCRQFDHPRSFFTVLKTIAATGTTAIDDPATLVVSYKSGNHFQDNDVIYDSLSNLAVQAIALDATGQSSVVSIAQGVFYISGNYTDINGLNVSNGTFVQVNPQTIILDKYSSLPSKRVGLNIVETIQDYVGDTSLLDPAIGASNYQAPGADRFKIDLVLATRTLDSTDITRFIELSRVESGQSTRTVDAGISAIIEDELARRTYDESGNYTVKVTDNIGCSETSTNTAVTVNAMPAIPTASASGTFFQGMGRAITKPAPTSCMSPTPARPCDS